MTASPDPTKPDTPASDDAPDLQTEAFKRVIDYIDQRIASGETKEEVAADVAQDLGWTPDQLIESIETANKEGNLGRGVLQATATLLGTVQQQTNDREGKREVASLMNDKKFGEAFEEHEKGFRAWLRSKNVSYGSLAEPGQARKNFDYFLKTETDYFEKENEKRRETIRAEERKKLEEEIGVRRRVPAPPSLPSGARPEGGALKTFIESSIGTDEPTETQSAVMSGLGLNEEQQKRAMSVQAKKTAFGTPLDFVKTKNEGAV